ncbi:unnamed protein product [Vitrella brassicaformis CCMP3155]|uniref:Uncharacterized protein n=1 Tax=Vitrella brassicaformis (strain CCMP3155) TaxID=1169540 RepID=A0A0G4EB48_VITBC|nr:unnamed protein product [Vitrella brassicaformis CCMP3155]|eukprot:CEL92464.1 unnamed protein product [Vitrella brassicaformis CCMP3155]
MVLRQSSGGRASSVSRFDFMRYDGRPFVADNSFVNGGADRPLGVFKPGPSLAMQKARELARQRKERRRYERDARKSIAYYYEKEYQHDSDFPVPSIPSLRLKDVSFPRSTIV